VPLERTTALLRNIGKVALEALANVDRVLYSEEDFAAFRENSRTIGRKNFWTVVNAYARALVQTGGSKRILAWGMKATGLPRRVLLRHLRTAELRGLIIRTKHGSGRGRGRSASRFELGPNASKLAVVKCHLKKHPAPYGDHLHPYQDETARERAGNLAGSQVGTNAPAEYITFHERKTRKRIRVIDLRQMRRQPGSYSREALHEPQGAPILRRVSHHYDSRYQPGDPFWITLPFVTIHRAGWDAVLNGTWRPDSYTRLCMSTKQRAMLTLAQDGVDPIRYSRLLDRFLRRYPLNLLRFISGWGEGHCADAAVEQEDDWLRRHGLDPCTTDRRHWPQHATEDDTPERFGNGLVHFMDNRNAVCRREMIDAFERNGRNYLSGRAI
jgi:hypothetical protein